MLIDRRRSRGSIGHACLQGNIGPEDKGIVAIQLLFEVEVDALVSCAGIRGRGLVGDIGCVIGWIEELLGKALLIRDYMGEIIEIAAIDF